MRSLVLSNGSLAITLDRHASVRDIFFPHVGLENHLADGMQHRVGVYVDSKLSWLSDGGWSLDVGSEEESLASKIKARHESLGVELTFQDVVYNESPVFLRTITVKNLQERERTITLYLGHQFGIYGTASGNTGYYDPKRHAIVHYKGQRVFLIAGTLEGKPFDDYAVGLSSGDGTSGTHIDALDGVLSKNPVEHGLVDSVIGFTESYGALGKKTARYWLCAGESVAQAETLHAYVLHKTPEHMTKTTIDFWKAWVNKYELSFYELTKADMVLFKRSLMAVRAHADNGGGIVASIDSDTLQHGKDTYAYVWPRDGAFAASALLRAGDTHVSERFFEFANSVIREEGYFMHKYLPDTALGSSWHPWTRDGVEQLPIQEDETALVIWALEKHYTHSRDLEFIEKLYNSLVEKAANFLVEYRNPATGLPLPSYDLWEERRGVSTFTASCVFGALMSAGNLAELLGKNDRASYYWNAAKEVRTGILAHLWNPETKLFVRMIASHHNNTTTLDEALDISSVYGIFAFDVLPQDDERLVYAFEETAKRLSNKDPLKGIARYEGDKYYYTGGPGNPWFVTTLWYAEFLTARAQNIEDMKRVRAIFTWVRKHALTSGVLSEQLSFDGNEQVSVAPLTWSHAGYVNAILKYLDRLETLGICTACNPVP